MPLLCRFYEKRFPDIEEVVMVNVRSIADMGAYVHLLEYNNIEGMILLSELSRRRIRSINKLIRIGRNECVVVIRVDKEKGYIDLSKRRVSPEEVAACEDKFARGKCVNSVLRHVAEILGYDSDEKLEKLYKKTAWYFDAKLGKPGASYDIFKQAVTNPEILDECGLDDKMKAVLLDNIKRKLTPQAVKIRSDIEVACYGYEGIDAVKNALRFGMKMSTEDFSIKVNLIAPPVYVVTTQTLDKQQGIAKLKEVNDKIKEVILKEDGGVFSVKSEPKVVSDQDEAELARQLEELQQANAEKSGDDDEDEDEEGEEGSDKENDKDGEEAEGDDPED